MPIRALITSVPLLLAIVVWLGPVPARARGAAGLAESPYSIGGAFPSVNEILQGRTFGSKFERDVFFLREVRRQYPAFWAPLLEANITANDYAWNPSKLQLFLEELGTAAKGSNDVAASTYKGDLIKGDHYISPTLTRYKGLWWLFTSAPGNDTLRLFSARDLKGPWTEHPQSPIVKKDLHTARPAGRPFVIDGTLYRLGMDCDPTYGSHVRAFQITDLSPTTYAEKMVENPLVKASSKGWNALAMHHMDALRTGPGEWIAVVDALGR
jgi:hypothetical protein